LWGNWNSKIKPSWKVGGKTTGRGLSNTREKKSAEKEGGARKKKGVKGEVNLKKKH